MPLELLTSLDLGQGASLEFHEPLPGEIVSVYVGKDEAFGEKFEALRRGDMTHSELFETLAGRKAPAALANAERRLLVARAEVEHNPPVPTNVDRAVAPPMASAMKGIGSGFGATRSGISASSFITNYCPLQTYLFCWTSRTGTGSVTRFSLSMESYVNAYRGQVKLTLDYRALWAIWTTYVSITVPEGSIAHVSRTGIHATRRATVSQASGDGYHMSVFGL